MRTGLRAKFRPLVPRRTVLVFAGSSGETAPNEFWLGLLSQLQRQGNGQGSLQAVAKLCQTCVLHSESWLAGEEGKNRPWT